MRRIQALLCCLVICLVGCTTKTNAAPKSPASTGTSAGRLNSSGPFPTIAGAFGDKPTLAFDPSKKPSVTLQRKVLHDGTGPAIMTGDLIAIDYLGQIWNGAIFDNSYDRHVATAVQIGIGQVIPGWDKSLVGVKVGSRVEITVPPDDGYGTAGNAEAKIKGTDTLVFVIDIGARYNGKSTADKDATIISQRGHIPTATGSLTTAPTITIPPGLAVPTKKSTYLLARGPGAAIANGTAVIQYSAIDWTGKLVSSTWQNGTATSVPVGGGSNNGAGGLFDTLAGVPVGSRVLIVAPAPAGQDKKTASAAVVIDVLAQVTTAKQMAASPS